MVILTRLTESSALLLLVSKVKELENTIKQLSNTINNNNNNINCT
jgi:hypothetical protein